MALSFARQTSTGTTEQPESKYTNGTLVEKMIDDSRDDLGQIDTKGAIRTLKHNWIDTLRDLRLLNKEGELESLHHSLPTGLTAWLMTECQKQFPDDELGGDITRYEYSFDLDKNGIVWSIATDRGNEEWKNPGDRGRISVRASSVMHDSVPVNSILGRDVLRCVTKPEKDSWMIVDFTPRRVRPTHYTLRHYSTWDTEALRNWRFEASNDGINWTVLRTHLNDAGLNAKGAPCTWELQGVKDFFNQFRIFQTDFNSNRHYYLALSGFEMYGDLEEGAVGGAAANDSLTFIPSHDFDSNGICHWLATNRGLEPWQNPADRGLVRITPSSLAHDSKPVAAVVGREIVRCVTEPKKLSWFMLDFAAVHIIPTHYTVRHYITFDTECLRNWRFDASNDSTNGVDGNWVTLMTHKNDTSLNHKGATHTWAIPQHVVNNQAYTKFRLFQYGVNSNQHHYLCLSGFEIYGTVVSGMEAIAAPVAQPLGPVRKLNYQYDFDTGGLFYFLGTRGGTTSWANPAEQGLIEVKASTLMSDSQPLSALVARAGVRCVTKPHQKSWMSISLKDMKMKLSHYTLRHYNSWDTEALRFWNLEASNDGVAWIPIRQHHDDRALRKAGMSHTWPVDCPQFYSHFRVYMTGRNSNNHWYLACSGMEFYGEATGGLVSQHVNAPVPSGNNMAAPPAAFGDAPVQPPMESGAPPPAFGGSMVGAPPNVGAAQPAQPQQMPQAQQPVARQNSSVFGYERDLDTNGVCHWLGTRCGTSATWQNPSELGAVVITASGVMNDSVPVHAIVGRSSVRAVTKPQKHSWFCIDFQEYAIAPTHYTLRHYSSWDTEALRNWRLEGSCDGERWVVLRNHVDDSSLNFKGQTFTWRLRPVGYFTMFRIFQFDKNSNNHYYLSLSGFEIYGSVVRQNRMYTWDQWPRNKSKCLQIDQQRNTVVNTGSDDTWQTVKAREPLQYNRNGITEFSLLIVRTENTSNSWKFMSGIAPEEFTCTGSKQWLGSQKSWGFIAGTGGKCYDVGKSMPYGIKWGNIAGELITIVANSQTQSVELFFNGQSQGKAFDNFSVLGRKIFAAASLTARHSRIRLMERVTPQSGPPKIVQQPMVGNKPAPPIGGAPVSAPHANNWHWDPVLISQHLAIFSDGVSVANKGSNDTWQGIVSQAVFSSGKHSYEIKVVNDVRTSNTWKFICGVVPVPFDPRRTGWLGSQNSWGYIAGTGGKCHQVGRTINYGKAWGGEDVVRCEVDFDRHTIEYFRNGATQGIAFNNLNCPVKPAVSLCGKGACLKIQNVR